MPERSLELLQCYCRLGRLCYQEGGALTPPMEKLIEQIDLILAGKTGMGRWFVTPEELSEAPETLLKLLPLEEIENPQASDTPEEPQPAQEGPEEEQEEQVNEPVQPVQEPSQPLQEHPEPEETPPEAPEEPPVQEEPPVEEVPEPVPEEVLEMPETPEVPETVTCPHCGKVVSHPGKYCIYCWQPLFEAD